MDSGKSSLVAVLTHGSNGRPLLDNGRGSARMSVLRHKHELESGRTSSISQQVSAVPPPPIVLFTSIRRSEPLKLYLHPKLLFP